MEVLCLRWLHAVPHARVQESLIGLAYERERERESIQISGTTKYLAVFLSSFFSSCFGKLHTYVAVFTPLLYRAQTEELICKFACLTR